MQAERFYRYLLIYVVLFGVAILALRVYHLDRTEHAVHLIEEHVIPACGANPHTTRS